MLYTKNSPTLLEYLERKANSVDVESAHHPIVIPRSRLAPNVYRLIYCGKYFKGDIAVRAPRMNCDGEVATMLESFKKIPSAQENVVLFVDSQSVAIM